MSRVFITQQPRPNKVNWVPNLTPALGYGTIHFVFGPEDKPYAAPQWAMDHAQVALRDFDPDEDYILYPNSGDPAAMWVIIMALSRMRINHIRFLYWERKFENGERSKADGFYTPIDIPLSL